MRFFMSETCSKTKIQLEYKNNLTATAIQKAITPDNIKAPKEINIKSYVKKNILLIDVSSNRNIGSLILTLDDLLGCIQAAEKSLENIT
jgi:hypothetical protein